MFARKTALVTGAAAGIGKELCLELAEQGFHILAVDVNTEGLRNLAEHGRKFSFEITTHEADVRDTDALARIAGTAHTSAPLSVWINNAAVGGLGALNELSDADIDTIIGINIAAVMKGTKLAVRLLEESGAGTIVNMASIAGFLPAPFMSAYVASKHAIVGFTRSVQEELTFRDSVVSTLLVAPGFVNTPLIKKGDETGFPEWLSFMLSDPHKVAKIIVKSLIRGDREIIPTMNGKLMKRMYGMFPAATVRSSRLLMTRSFKDFLLNRYNRQ